MSFRQQEIAGGYFLLARPLFCSHTYSLHRR